jgi:hypothetical protein
MRRRWILVVTALLVIAASGSALTWPRGNRESQTAIAQIRALLEPVESLPTDEPLPKADAESKIGLDICLLTINTTKATCDLFPEGKGQRLIGGRLKGNDPKQFLVALGKIDCVEISPLPTAVYEYATSGQPARTNVFCSGKKYVLFQDRGPENPPTVNTGSVTDFPEWNMSVGITPAVAAQSNAVIEMGVILFRHAIPNSLEDSAAHRLATTVSGKFRSQIKPGETLVLGGLKQTWTQKSTRPIPLLGRLPVIGPAFTREYDDVHDEEGIVLVTLSPTAESKK